MPLSPNTSMAITRGTSARTVSPTPSENNCQCFGWDNTATPMPKEAHEVTPTPQPARTSSPASVIEISMDDFPLSRPRPRPSPLWLNPALRASPPSLRPMRDNDDPFLAADTIRAVAASLSLPTMMDQTMAKALSSCRLAAGAGSLSKHLCTNSVGPASPAPYTAVAVTPLAAPAVVPAAAHCCPCCRTDHYPHCHGYCCPPLLPCLWLTADGLPPHGLYTLTPAGGFPTIVFSPEQLLHGIPVELIRMYDNVAHPKFFIAVSSGNANIPDHLAQTIVDNHIISSTSITLFPFPTTCLANVARDLIRTTIAANNEFTQFVQTHWDALGPQVSVGEASTTFLHLSRCVASSSLSMTPTPSHGASLLTPPPMTRGFCCRICPSIDHLTPLCPLPGIPGWLSPTPATIAVLEEASHQVAAKVWEQMHPNTFNDAGGSSLRPGNGHNQGSSSAKPRRDAKGKRGDFKGKGKHHEHNDYF
ncbi:hypothetical protein B0H13DRAFT_2372403 [Mycena leptocephala]|nr:hypothetical protein B0H13DRAFT_2372403 [Mycena leptocephala]